jgi:hypothetical protein
MTREAKSKERRQPEGCRYTTRTKTAMQERQRGMVSVSARGLDSAGSLYVG